MTPAEIVRDYAPAVACVEVVDEKTGEHGLGTAFHVGSGIFVTAAHVFEGKTIKALSTTLPTTKADKDGWRRPLYAARIVAGSDLTIHRHTDASVDVACIKAPLDAAVIPLGLHLDQGRVNMGGTHDRDEGVARARARAAEHAGGRWALFFVESSQSKAELARFVVPDAGFLAHPRREPA